MAAPDGAPAVVYSSSFEGGRLQRSARVRIGKRRGATLEFFIEPKVLLRGEPNVLLEQAEQPLRVAARRIARQIGERRADIDSVIALRQAPKKIRQDHCTA